MRKLIDIVNEAGTSSYDARVQEVANAVVAAHEENQFRNKGQIKAAIDVAAQNVTDYKMGGTTRNQFVRDVVEALKGRIVTRRTGGAQFNNHVNVKINQSFARHFNESLTSGKVFLKFFHDEGSSRLLLVIANNRPDDSMHPCHVVGEGADDIDRWGFIMWTKDLTQFDFHPQARYLVKLAYRPGTGDIPLFYPGSIKELVFNVVYHSDVVDANAVQLPGPGIRISYNAV